MLSKNIVDIKNVQNNIIKSLYLDEVIWEKQGGIKWYGVDELLAMDNIEEHISAVPVRDKRFTARTNTEENILYSWGVLYYIVRIKNKDIPIKWNLFTKLDFKNYEVTALTVPFVAGMLGLLVSSSFRSGYSEFLTGVPKQNKGAVYNSGNELSILKSDSDKKTRLFTEKMKGYLNEPYGLNTYKIKDFW